MACWKWFDNVLKEAGIDGHVITARNRKEIDEIINQYISEQAKYGHCSADWEKAGKEIQDNEQMKQELAIRLRLLYLRWIRHKDY